jgi:hypothetical protein
MFIDIIKAILLVGIPVGVFSFLMIYYAYLKGYLSTDVEFRHAFKKQNKAHSTLSKKHKKNLLFLHSKWVTFGGGFYGLIALLTFIVIELLQIVNFWLNVSSWQDISALFTIQALISMFVDSIVNMVKAAIWFTYWPEVFDTSNFIAWVLVAYLGYRLGAKFAKDYLLRERESVQEESDES